MKLAVLADDSGKIIAIAVCRLSLTGQVGTFTEDVEIRGEIRRSQLTATPGQSTPDYTAEDDLIKSVIVELPSELEQLSLDEIQDQMVLERGHAGPSLARLKR